MKTKKIVIKSTSGFCPVDYAYNDKLTITANSIAYEYGSSGVPVGKIRGRNAR